MPRREAFQADSGDDGLLGPPDRFAFAHTLQHSSALQQAAAADGRGSGSGNQFHQYHHHTGNQHTPREDAELVELERRLNEEVDEDFFEEPRKFHTLQRVIDVLGLQMMDDATLSTSLGASGTGGAGPAMIHGLDVSKNPAYRQLKQQQEIVEGAIEHMAVIHCADLNGSVIQVGRVARQFSEAVQKVRVLRRQVRDIQDGLGGGGGGTGNPNEPRSTGGGGPSGGGLPPASAASASRPQNAAAMSLRELWLKKLECEAALSLLDKLDVVRAAPSKFDQLLQPPQCRIGAAVLTLSEALQTMFSDDVAQVGALHKIMEQLMLRKQRAEEIVWDTLSDVVYLRTGHALESHNTSGRHGKSGSSSYSLPNGLLVTGPTTSSGGAGAASSSHSVSSESRRSLSRTNTGTMGTRQSSTSSTHRGASSDGMINPFFGRHRRRRFALDEDLDDSHDTTTDGGGWESDDDDAYGSGASLFSLEDGDDDNDDNSTAGLETTDDSGVPSSSQPSAATTTTTTMTRPKPSSRAMTTGSVISGGDATTVRGGVTTPAKATTTTRGTRLPTAAQGCRMLIPIPLLEAELDLEQDERRCLEEIALSGRLQSWQQQQQQNALRHHSSSLHRHLPRYLDPVLALKILVECLHLLKRLDDVERVLAEGLEREIRRIVQREQARTFARLERRARRSGLPLYGATSGAGKPTLSNLGLLEFRQHLTGLLSAFGCVMVRLSHLAEILRFRIGSDKELLHKFGTPSSVMRSVLSNAYDIMQREIKGFLRACLRESESARTDVLDPTSQGSSAYEKNLFSLGIVEDTSRPGQSNVSTATRTNVMEMTVPKFVVNILCAKTKTDPQVRHALTFRRSVARWTTENEALKTELAGMTGEDTSAASFKAANEEPAIAFLDTVIQKELLPVLQEEAVNGTVKGLEHRDAFDPVLDRTLYSRPDSNEPQDVDMCKACQAMYDSTGPLFLALHRLPPGGDMYTPLVAVLEHVMLTFISRVKQQVGRICGKKTAATLLEDEDKPGSLSLIAEKRRPFALLLRAYADGDLLESHSSTSELVKQSGGLMPLSPPSTDTAPRKTIGDMKSDTPLEDVADGVDGEERIYAQEAAILQKLLDFDGSEKGPNIVVCSDEDLMKASCLAHSLLKLAGLLLSRLKVRQHTSDRFKTLTATRTLQEAIKTIKRSGIKMAKFCRFDMTLQAVTRMSKVPTSSTIAARDAVRIPSSVNDLGEYLTSASDNLREAAGNAVTAYTFSSLEQYIPYCILQVVRVLAQGKGVLAKAPLTMNGIEALDRSGSVLYRDLKGATSFDNSFWDVELAAVCFERSASFIALLELEMDELVAYYTANRGDFSEDDYILMFSMTGPRRRGDVGQYHMLRRRMKASA